MRKFIFLLVLLTLLVIPPALAETYSFADIHATVEIPDDYEVVLTPHNLSAHSDWLAQQGLDFDSVSNSFEADGVLLKAIDADNNRTLVITALQDLDAQIYFDLNNQDEDMRREFRVSHTEGTSYTILGYSYTSAQWRNYGGDELRFLQTKYSLRENGQQVHTGYQRRTIRNGYTITLDMQVTGRSAKETDSTALEKVMKTFQFTEILPMPELPVKLSVSSAPPSETNHDEFTIKGTTVRKAEVKATVFSMGATGSQTFSDTASSNGDFSIKVELPSQGMYSITLTAQAEGAITAQRLYSVSFQKGRLPVDLMLTPPETLTDSTIISGSTLSGARTQLSVSGPVSYNRTTTSKDFKFVVDTDQEGEYHFVLTVNKSGLEERNFTFTGKRQFSEGERVEKVKDAATRLSYANLPKSSNEGRTVVCTGYITNITETVGEWVMTVALRKSNDEYRDIVYVICGQQPLYEVGTKINVYGKAAGVFSELNASGSIKNYPRVESIFFELAD